MVGGRAGTSKEHIADETAVITRVIDDVLQDFEARHRARVAADQREVHFFVERGVGLARRPTRCTTASIACCMRHSSASGG